MKTSKHAVVSTRLIIPLIAGLAMVGGCSASTALTDDPMEMLPVVSVAEQGLTPLIRRLTTVQTLDRIPDEPHIFPVNIDLVPQPEWARYAGLIAQSLDHGGIVILMGGARSMAAVKPAWLKVWPGGDAVVMNGRWGGRVDALIGAGARDPMVLAGLVENQLSQIDASLEASRLRTRGVIKDKPGFDKDVSFSIRPVSPTETCIAFGNEVARSIPNPPITPELRDALAIELRRWCQSGTLADITPNELPRQMGQWRREARVKVNLLTEWALIKSASTLKPADSRNYFWVKSVGEGAGSGFTREASDVAVKRDDVMVGLVDAAMHAGWGSIMTGQAGWTYPTPPAYWAPEDPTLFSCELHRPADQCPVNPRLVRLFPTDSFNDSVTVAKWTALAFGGVIKGTFDPTTGKPTIGLDLSVTKTETQTATATLKLTDISTNAARIQSRTTRWRPNVAAVWDYLTAGRIEGPFGSATPTASTINPEYDALWLLPNAGNVGRTLRFGVVFEAGWNSCVRYACAGNNPPPDRRIQSQGRGIWNRTIEVKVEN